MNKSISNLKCTKHKQVGRLTIDLKISNMTLKEINLIVIVGKKKLRFNNDTSSRLK